MELSLAIAVTCEPTGCQVRYLDGGETSTVRYSTAVQNQIRIRSGDLVVIDSATDAPEIVWRWWNGRVEGVDDEMVVVSRKVRAPRPGEPERAEEHVPLPDWLARSIAPGDTVFYTCSGGGIVDVARKGLPAHPERVCSESFPQIIATYERMQNAS